MFLSLSTSILLNLMPVLTSAGFKQRFTFIPLCKPMPSNSIGSLSSFLLNFLPSLIYIQKAKNAWKTTYITKEYNLIS